MVFPRFNNIDQIGIIVEDAEQAIQVWIQQYGVGPWTLIRNATMQGEYLGQPTTISYNVAMGYRGSTQIELMEITSDGPDPYRNEAGHLSPGIHHIAQFVDDVESELHEALDAGMKLIFKGETPGVRIAYLATEGQPGMMLEFIEAAEFRKQVAVDIETAKNWDGSNPIKVIDLPNG